VVFHQVANRVYAESSDGVTLYHIGVNPITSEFICQCPAGRSKRDCRHLKAARKRAEEARS
jgi:hypothetical protein